MAHHTFVCSGRRRLEIQPSKTDKSLVLIQILNEAREVLAACTVPASTAGVIAQALELEAAAIEARQAASACTCAASKQEKFKPPCVCRIADALRPCMCSGGRVGPAMVQAYADTNGVTPMHATVGARFGVIDQDPKYDFVGGRIWNRNGNYFLPDDEPVMVLRGKDQACLAAIFGYIECLEKQAQTKHVLEHIKTSRERLGVFFEFQTKNPERAGIGCTVAEKLQVASNIFHAGKAFEIEAAAAELSMVRA